MARIEIFGQSDDLIEIEGDLREEFNCYDPDDKKAALFLSDGTVLSVKYDDEGIWRFNRIMTGSATYDHKPGMDSDGDDYTDRVTLEGDIRWIAYSEKWERVKGKDNGS